MLHPTCRKNEGKNLGRHLELSERWGHLLGNNDEGSGR